MTEKTFNVLDSRDKTYLGTYLATSSEDAKNQFQLDKYAKRNVQKKHLRTLKGVKYHGK